MRKLHDSEVVGHVDLQTRKLLSPRKSVKRTSFVNSSAVSWIYALLKPQITLFVHIDEIIGSYLWVYTQAYVRTFQILMTILLLERYILMTIYHRNWS